MAQERGQNFFGKNAGTVWMRTGFSPEGIGVSLLLHGVSEMQRFFLRLLSEPAISSAYVYSAFRAMVNLIWEVSISCRS